MAKFKFGFSLQAEFLHRALETVTAHPCALGLDILSRTSPDLGAETQPKAVQ